MEIADRPGTERGFTLLEALLALALSLVLLGTLFHFLIHYQRFGLALMNVIEAEQRLLLTPLALNAVLAGAGNHLGSDALSVAHDPPSLEADADLTGPGGFPDGQLSGPFEQVALLSRDGALRLRSAGGGFQPLVAGLTLDSVAVAEPTLLILRLSNGPPPDTLADTPGGDSVELALYLWNRRGRFLGEAP